MFLLPLLGTFGVIPQVSPPCLSSTGCAGVGRGCTGVQSVAVWSGSDSNKPRLDSMTLVVLFAAMRTRRSGEKEKKSGSREVKAGERQHKAKHGGSTAGATFAGKRPLPG